MAQMKKLRDQAAETQQYMLALNKKLDQLTVRAAQLGETLAAIVKHLGEDVITKVMNDERARRRAEHDAELAKSVDLLVNEGMAVLAPEGATVDIDSFVVGKEVYADGTSVRIQHETRRLDQAGQARWFGKKVGDEITEPGFPSKVVVEAIYKLDMAKVQEFAARKKAEAREKQEAAVQQKAAEAAGAASAPN